MFICGRCLRSSAAKYELDIIQVTTVFIIQKKLENNGREKIGLVTPTPGPLLSGVPDLWDRNKVLSGGDLSYHQVPHCIRVFFYFVWFVFIHHNFQFYFELCTYCNILNIYLS